jgi:hypothetical protein
MVFARAVFRLELDLKLRLPNVVRTGDEAREAARTFHSCHPPGSRSLTDAELVALRSSTAPQKDASAAASTQSKVRWVSVEVIGVLLV